MCQEKIKPNNKYRIEKITPKSKKELQNILPNYRFYSVGK